MSFNHCCNPCDEPKCVTDLDLDSSGKTLLVTYSDGQTEDIDLSSLLDWMTKDDRFKDAVKKLLRDPQEFLQNMKRLLNNRDALQVIDGDTIRVDKDGRLYVPDATVTQKGVIRIATDGEAQGGDDGTTAITPRTLKAALDAFEAPPPDADSILGNLTDCAGTPLTSDTAMASCVDLNSLREELNNRIDGIDTTPDVDPSSLVSKEAGNRIEAREDGLGVFDRAPPSLAVQYVNTFGDDSNPGTEDAPLKTFHRAVERINDGTKVGNYDIYLQSGQTHRVAQNLFDLPNATIRIGGYGDPTYGRTFNDAEPDYYPGNSSEYSRPVLAFDVYTRDIAGQQYVGIPMLGANVINIIGVDLDVTGPDTTEPGWFNCPFVTLGAFDVIGSDITLGNSHSLSRSSSMRVRNVNITFQGEEFINSLNKPKLADPTFGPTIEMLAQSAFAGQEQGFTSDKPNYRVANWRNRANVTPDNIGLNFIQIDGSYIPTNGGINWNM